MYKDPDHYRYKNGSSSLSSRAVPYLGTGNDRGVGGSLGGIGWGVGGGIGEGGNGTGGGGGTGDGGSGSGFGDGTGGICCVGNGSTTGKGVAP